MFALLSSSKGNACSLTVTCLPNHLGIDCMSFRCTRAAFFRHLSWHIARWDGESAKGGGGQGCLRRSFFLWDRRHSMVTSMPRITSSAWLASAPAPVEPGRCRAQMACFPAVLEEAAKLTGSCSSCVLSHCLYLSSCICTGLLPRRSCSPAADGQRPHWSRRRFGESPELAHTRARIALCPHLIPPVPVRK
jgi:hypothetical protein